MKLKSELKRAIINIWFITPLFILTLISSLDILFAIKSYNLFLNTIKGFDDIEMDMCIPVFTSFNFWIGNNSSLYSTIFFWTSPLLAALPYSWAYCRKKNYRKSSLYTDSKEEYLLKYISVFISSGLIALIPLFINFIAISLVVPSIKPDSIYDINYGIFSNNYVGVLFYKFPYIYVLFYGFLNFVFNGLIGGLGISISTISKSKITAVLFPSIIIFLLEKLKGMMQLSFEISPVSFLCPSEPQHDNGYIIIGEILIIIILSIVFSGIGLRGKKCEK